MLLTHYNSANAAATVGEFDEAVVEAAIDDALQAGDQLYHYGQENGDFSFRRPDVCARGYREDDEKRGLQVEFAPQALAALDFAIGQQAVSTAFPNGLKVMQKSIRREGYEHDFFVLIPLGKRTTPNSTAHILRSEAGAEIRVKGPAAFRRDQRQEVLSPQNLAILTSFMSQVVTSSV